MKSKKKNFLFIASIFTAVLCIGAVVISNNGGISFKELVGEHQKYSLTLNADNKISAAEKTTFTRNTAMGNPISFTATNFNNRSEAEWFGQLGSGFEMSHLENTTSIGGIEKITIKSQFKANKGGYRISAGASSSDLTTRYERTEAYKENDIVSRVFDFGGEVNFFKITNIGTGCGTYFNEIKIEFSCVPADGTRDAKEKASGDLLTGAYLNSGSIFESAGYSYDMRCSDVNGSESGYSAKFHGDVGTSGWPVAIIELPNEVDLRGYGLTLDVKFVNAHNWFAFSALDSDESYIIRSQYGGIGVDTTKDLGNYVSAMVAQADINNSEHLEPGRTISDLAHVKYFVFTFNFENAPSASELHEVTIDNIKLVRGQRYLNNGDQTYAYIDLGSQFALTETIAFDIKFDNPTVHQEVGFNFYEDSWGKYFGKYWIDTTEGTGKVYFEGSYNGLKFVYLTDGYVRVYANLSKLNASDGTKPTSYVQYIWFSAPNTVSNRGEGWIDVLPLERVPGVTEIISSNVSFTAKENCTCDFPSVRKGGTVIAELTFNDSTNKASVMTGNWTKYNGYFDLYSSTTGNPFDGVYAESTGLNSIRVVFKIGEMTKGSSQQDVIDAGGYQFFYIRGDWTTASGTVNVYFKY